MNFFGTQAQIGRIITFLVGEIRNLSPSLTSFSGAFLHDCNEMQMLWNVCEVRPAEELVSFVFTQKSRSSYCIVTAEPIHPLLHTLYGHMQTVRHTYIMSHYFLRHWILLHAVKRRYSQAQTELFVLCKYTTHLCAHTVFPNRIDVHGPMQINCVQDGACVGFVPSRIASPILATYIKMRRINNATPNLTLRITLTPPHLTRLPPSSTNQAVIYCLPLP